MTLSEAAKLSYDDHKLWIVNKKLYMYRIFVAAGKVFRTEESYEEWNPDARDCMSDNWEIEIDD